MALGMRRIDLDIPMDDATRVALGAMLLYDEDHTRSLSRDEFAKFYSHFCDLLGLNPQSVAWKVEDAYSRNKPTREDREIVEEVERKLMPKIIQTPQEIIKLSQHPPLQALFDQWDEDNDGLLSLQELAMGLSKFQPSQDISNIIVQAAAALMEYDMSKTKSLDRLEFTGLVINLAQTARAPIDGIVDFLLLQTSIKKNDSLDADAAADIEDAMQTDVKNRRDSLTR
ncbi:hypothetical protein SARC_11452 [Sphaeroforma arctica JP610]|uniref:EF-hand domain-containing protein n=1 Tax=Sphaeroforma arctica JP610 TaxID=667725 RepID=A0A0L0FHT7_9EUKA|nr:hypothetical protein SARC_11452 [Sphaeroforma arctica JP610]KNC76036.1 hypothetical protein SARC_11452 [Sphaeroforma arctica JP610]|eukprot:XP_014149938.1 hypothetical protein SARC_11452 [Sphaeroforma arctica JP610]